MPGSNSAFIPTINAITTSQDLQWMVQPTVITSMSNPYSRSHPYGHHLTNGPGLLGHNALTRPGVIRSIGDARGRRKRDEQVRDLQRPPADFFFNRDCKTPHLHRQALKNMLAGKRSRSLSLFYHPIKFYICSMVIPAEPSSCLNTRPSLQTACFICHLPFVFAHSSPQRKRRRGG